MDLVLPCSTVVLTDTLVLPIDGANCRDTVLVDPILVCQVLAQKVPHNEFFVEYGLKNLVSVSLNGLLHGLREYRNKNEKDGREERSLSNDKVSNLINGHRFMQIKFLYRVLSSLFLHFRPPLLGDFYILYRPSPIIWVLHLLIIQTPT